MKTLIFLPGVIDDPFFENEIKYFKKYFDKVFVISYEGDKRLFDELSNKYDFEYKVVKQFSPVSLLKAYLTGWRFSQPVKEEFKNHLGSSSKISKKMYALFYGAFAIQAKPYMDKIVDEAEGDVYIFSYWLSRPAYASALMNINRNKKVKAIVSRAHAFDIYKERVKNGYLPFRTFIHSNLDHVSFVTQHGLNYFNKNWPETNNLIKDVVYLGSGNPGLIRKKIIEKKIPVIATTAYISDVKRYDLIIETLSKLASEFVWVQYGEGQDIDKIKNLAENKLKSKSYIFKGNIPNSKILEQYITDDVDFLLNLSDSEGLPVTYMEAMSVGIPVLTRDVGGCKEMVNSTNGILLENTPNTDAWAKIIDEELKIRIDNISSYTQKSENAFNTWADKFNSDENFERYLKRLSMSEFT